MSSSFFPPSTGGLPGLNGATIYVSPTGNNNNDGKTWSTAVKNGYNGYAKIVEAGGGWLFLANEVVWGGPVTGQGAWFRQTIADSFVIPGFQEIVPCNIIGMGTEEIFGSAPGKAILYAGSNDAADYRTKPAVWQIRSNIPVNFYNIQVKPVPGHTDSQTGNYAAFRIGWDYFRNNDGSIAYMPVTSSTRTGTTANGSTVHTVTLLPAVNVTSASRTSNVTTLTIPRPNLEPFPPWKTGSKIWFQSTDVNFTSGAYTVAGCSAGIGGADTDWTVTIADVAANHGSVANPGTVRSNYVTLNDIIELQSTSAQFPSSAYRVTAATITNSTTGTITVADVYGGYNGVTNNAGPTANIGQIAIQSRSYGATLGVNLTNCSSERGQDLAKYTSYAPMFDFGATLAFPPVMDGCYIQALYPTVASGAPFDRINHSGVLAWGEEAISPSIVARNCTGQQAIISFSGGQTTAECWLENIVFNAVNDEAPPAFIINGAAAASVKLNDITVADALPGWGGDLNTIGDMPLTSCSGNNVPGMGAQFYGKTLIGNLGLGINTAITKVVGVGSGQLTLTGSGTIYEPRYGKDGTTILGWVALLQATVNP